MGAWLWVGAALAGDPTWAGTCGDVDRFEVLAFDVDKGLVAFKNVVHDEGVDELGESVDCDYAGMDALPTSGVELGVFDLRARSAETFTVYAMVKDAAKCTPHAESEARLAAAKARFAELGLDIASAPIGAAPTKEQVVLPKGEGSVAVAIRASPTLRDEEAGTARSYTELRLGSTSLYRRDVTWTTAMAGYHGVAFTSAFAADGKAFLVEKHEIGSLRGGEICHTFTSVVSLP